VLNGSDTGAPLPAVEMWARTGPERGRELVGRTDADGKIRFTWPADAAHRTSLDLEADGFITRRIHSLARLPSSHATWLPAAVAIGGTVVDEANRPIAGAEVRAQVFSRLGMGRANEGLLQSNWDDPAVTDEDGCWRAAVAVASTVWGISLEIQHLDFLRHSFQHRDEDPDAFQRFTDGEHRSVMQVGDAVSGRVVDAEGQPLAGADVAAISGDMMQSGPWPHTTPTAEDGTFVARFGEGRPRYVMAQKEGFRTAVVPLRPDAEPAELEIALEAGLPIRVRVSTPDAQPIAGASVRSIQPHPRFRILTGTTEADGTWISRSGPPELVQLQVSARGVQTGSATWASPADNPVDVQLKPLPTVTFRVVDAETGEAIPRFTVTPGTTLDGMLLAPMWRDSDLQVGEGGQAVYYLSSGQLEGCVFRVDAEGYRPQQAEITTPVEQDVTLAMALHPALPVEGGVLDPDGRPAVEALVFLLDAHALLGLYQPGYTGILESVRRLEFDHAFTGEDGRFAVPAGLAPRTLVAAHRTGYAYLSRSDWTQPVEIPLQPYAAVSGSISPAGERAIAVKSPTTRVDPDDPFTVQVRTVTDGEGRFAFEGMVAGRYEAGRITGSEGPYDDRNVIVDAEFDLAPGEGKEIQLGGIGRPIRGRAVVSGDRITAIDWTTGQNLLSESPPFASYPVRGQFDTDEAYEAAAQRDMEQLEAYRETEAGQRFYARKHRDYPLEIDAAGVFRTGAIPPGWYLLSLHPGTGGYGGGAPIGEGAKVFEVPAVPGGYTDEPFDVGEVPVYLLPTLWVGMEAPDFEAQDAAGEIVRLSDLRGKWVLLDFWSTSCGPCIAELLFLREAYDACKGRPDFAMLGMSLDEDWETIERFMQREPMPWQHCRLGAFGTSTVLRAYGVHGIPESFLISPQGIVLARGMRGRAVWRTIREHLPDRAPEPARPDPPSRGSGGTRSSPHTH
jgi:peroxiredoxin